MMSSMHTVYEAVRQTVTICKAVTKEIKLHIDHIGSSIYGSRLLNINLARSITSSML